MRIRAVGWGITGATALVAFYVTVLTTAAGWEHALDQARTDWWLVGPIVTGFGVQVALTVELRARHRAARLAASTGAGTGASAVGMVACCAHHLADLVPLVGATGLAGFLFDWRVPFMLAGLAVNAIAIGFAARRLREPLHHTPEVTACAA